MQAAILAKKMANKRNKADLNASDKTKQMLGQIMDKFTTFDKEMKIGTRVRFPKQLKKNGGCSINSRLSLHNSNGERRKRGE
jgi:hypothetical protein